MNYIKLVEKINQDLYELIPEEEQETISFIEENPPIEIKSIGYSTNIYFFNIPIWQSENDERPCEDEPDYCIEMPLEKWLWQEITRIASLINQLGEILKKEK